MLLNSPWYARPFYVLFLIYYFNYVIYNFQLLIFIFSIKLHVVSLILTLILFVSVCPPRDLWNETSYRSASFAGVKRFSWRVAQTAFQAYKAHGSRGEVFGTFQQVMRWRPCTHVTLPGYPGQNESCPLFQRHWNILEGCRYSGRSRKFKGGSMWKKIIIN